MRFPIRPGKVTCAGLVGILMVLPNSIWKGPDAKVQPPTKAVIASRTITTDDSARPRLKFRKVPR